MDAGHNPKEVSVKQPISRRGFMSAIVTFMGSAIGAIVGLPGIAYLVSPGMKEQKSNNWLSLGPLDGFRIGVPTAFNYTTSKINGWEKTVKSSTVYIVRNTEGHVKAFSNICTHLSCNASWHKEQGHYICPCHDAHYAMDGAVISGPAPRPLDQYETKMDSGNLFIHITA